MLFNEHEIVITKTLRVRVVITDPETGHDIFVFGDRELDPGDTVSWAYPAGGLKITMD